MKMKVSPRSIQTSRASLGHLIISDSKEELEKTQQQNQERKTICDLSVTHSTLLKMYDGQSATQKTKNKFFLWFLFLPAVLYYYL